MAKRNQSKSITHAEVRMYRMGTGDCFVIKLFTEEKEQLKIMIDAGVWQGSKARLTPYIKDLKSYVDNHVNILLITHEHQDHVLAFQRCKDLFTNDFTIDQIWLAWTENEQAKVVKEWKEDYGQKKRALGIAARQLQDIIEDPDYQKQFEADRFSMDMLGARKSFSKVLSGFAELHMSRVNKVYTGGLKGMEIVKNELSNNNIRYCEPGEIIENIQNAPGIKVYILGPPRDIIQVKKEHGKKGETYEHNKDLSDHEVFAAALTDTESSMSQILPFDTIYVEESPSQQKLYTDPDNAWRKIDHDWLYSAGSMALRMNSLTNNLSLAIAIEFEESGRVMLFPGDAEYGSWESWHKIDWSESGNDPAKHLTEDLLNRTVLYKVAHHMSHNGTAKTKGLEMMTHKDLAAMATLDYDQISSGWTSTMPNRAITKELLDRTKGRIMVMNEKNLFFDLSDQIKLSDKILEARSKMSQKDKERFTADFKSNKLYLQFTVRGE